MLLKEKKCNGKSEIDIIIVNYNSTDCVIDCLKSIQLCSKDISTNIIVQDNASIDHPERIRKLFPRVNLINNHKNIGFAKAVNSAFHNSQSDLVMILNPDTLIMKGFFKKICKIFDKQNNIGIVGPKIIETNGEIQGSARTFPTPLTTLFGRKSKITKLFPNNTMTRKNILTHNHDGRTTLDVEWVTGACMVARREAICEIDGFDERFFLYWEDADLCKRLKDKGWRILYYPKAKVAHLTGQSSLTKPYFSIYHFHRSCYLLFNKYARWPMKAIQPIAFVGLALRAILTVILNYISRFNKKEKEIKCITPIFERDHMRMQTEK